MSSTAELTVEQAPERGGTPKPGLQRLVAFYRPRLSGLLVLMAYALTAVLIYAGWHSSAERPLTAEHGLGYTLGIVGGSLMLALMLYPLRKHLRAMRSWGAVRHWFRLHMLFGVLGPVCILFHSSFSLGSLNSNIAMFCMLAVASSGLVGRYFYTRIHHGLYGRKASLEELSRHAKLLDQSLAEELSAYPELLERIQVFEQRTHTPPRGILGSLILLFSLGLRTWSCYLSLKRAVARCLPARQRRALLRHMGARLQSIRKVAEFNFYARLFSIWHVLHFPLFLMLIVSGVVHVIAVHMY